ncbi:MAG: helix-turn-helix domain-containing protein, partial [Planctomycetes bacterium]|nr:helix-turn-helix domain-containing protein [Planctomycetota bacterium]
KAITSTRVRHGDVPVLIGIVVGTRRADVETLLTIPQTAKILNVPVNYAYELARRGEIKSVKVGPKYVRVRPEDLQAYVNAGKNNS